MCTRRGADAAAGADSDGQRLRSSCAPATGPPLRRCLDALDRQLAVPGGIEMLVVDNGSRDETAELLADWSVHATRERRRVIDEPTPGLSRARNTGVAARATTSCCSSTTMPSRRGWLAAHVAVYERDPAVVAVGGPVMLAWPNGRPAWITPRLAHWWSATRPRRGRDDVPRPAWAVRHEHVGAAEHVSVSRRVSGRRSAVVARPAVG